MTALAADLNLQSKGGGDLKEYLVADNVTIYKGGIVVLDSSGYARPARATAGEIVIGIADVQFNNKGTGHAAGARASIGGVAGLGDKGVRVISGRHFLLLCSATAAQTSVGATFSALDDQTVQAAAGTPVGIVTEYVDATHVWVFVDTPGLGDISNGETVTAGDVKVTAGNLRLGAISAFGTTEPTSAVVMKVGTAPVGAITTSGGLFSSSTVVRKIIADGTASNVET